MAFAGGSVLVTRPSARFSEPRFLGANALVMSPTRKRGASSASDPSAESAPPVQREAGPGPEARRTYAGRPHGGRSQDGRGNDSRGNDGRGRDSRGRDSRALDRDEDSTVDDQAVAASLEREGARLVPCPELAEKIDHDALKVIRRLRRHGYTAFLVGGGVRDLLLGANPKDFDVATSAHPHEVKAVFRNCRLIGRRFRLAHILYSGGKIIEVATFRRSPETGGDASDLLIRRDNDFGEPFEDAYRRDFTINGLFYDLGGARVVDFVGGLADVDARSLRMIGDPTVRLREDPVRIMRAIKFSARLDLGIDPELHDALVAQRGELAKAATARLFEEILRFLRGGAAARSFYLAWEMGVLAELMPALSAFIDDGGPGVTHFWRTLSTLDARVRADGCPEDAALFTLLVLQLLLEHAPDPAKCSSEDFDPLWDDFQPRLAVPKRLRELVRCIVRAYPRMIRGKAGAFVGRDYFTAAQVVAEVERAAAGETLVLDLQDTGGGPTKRRRRRRRPTLLS